MSFKDYLPSKTFQKRLFYIVLIVVIILVIGFIIKLIGRGIDAYKIRKQIKQLPVELRSQVDSLTVGDLQRKDSNNNGILDWEERLYGLDPLVDGEGNKKIVEEKRQILRLSADDNVASSTEGETNDFTREFLSIIGTLETSGALNEDALQNIANSIGGKITQGNEAEIYPKESFVVVRNSQLANDEYQRLSSSAIEKIGTIGLMGSEMEFIAESLRGGDPALLAPLDNIADTYESFAKALLKIPVPESLLDSHKALVNSSIYVGRGLDMIQKVNTDPMTAVQGTAMYNTHYLIMNAALDELAANLNL